jgi:hypothetical protein
MMPNRSDKNPPKNMEAVNNARLARHGLSLPRAILRALEKSGIYCFPAVSVEHQHLAHRFVLKGTESGGAVESMGRYCGYVDKSGQPIPWLQPLDSFGGSGRHAIVIAAELVRIEMLRIERTYELLISHHTLDEPNSATRSRLHSTVLFRGKIGTLPEEIVAGSSAQSGRKAVPLFYTGAGEAHTIPSEFHGAVCAATLGVSCIRCKHTHIAIRPKAATSGPDKQDA